MSWFSWSPSTPAPGATRTTAREVEDCQRLHDLRPVGEAVDEGTWRDLDLEAVFAVVDRTVSWPGAQVLFADLRSWAPSETAVRSRAALRERLASDPTLRARLQASLARLDRPTDARLATLLFQPVPPAPRHAWALPLMALLPLPCLLLGFLGHPWLLLPALLGLLANLWLNETVGRWVSHQASDLGSLHRLLGVCGALGREEASHLAPLEALRSRQGLVQRVRLQVGFLALDRQRLPEPFGSLLGWLNLLFLVDILLFLRLRRVLEAVQGELAACFLAAGELDAAAALALVPGLRTPTFRPGPPEGAALRHPCLEGAVPNDLAPGSLLITGSNMAGKSTYLRTVGVNLVLARTLGLAFADGLALPWLQVHASLGREGRLSEGRSTYLAEAETLGRFLALAEGAGPHLFLVDEIFRGTNTVERLAASTAVLRHLAAWATVLVTTHDLELESALKGTYAMGHFTEVWTEAGLGFDHRLRPGPVRTRNALRLLEACGYPADVVAEARALAGSGVCV